MNKRKLSRELLELEALVNRTSPHHSRHGELKQEFLKKSAGHFGETTTDYYLQYLNDSYHILKDLRLFDGLQHFQIDALLVADNRLHILEVKNYKGKMIFDFEHQQLFRIQDGVKDIFPDPFIQVELQAFQLSRWLSERQFPPITISSYVVIANPQTVVKTHGHHPQHKKSIVRAKHLPPTLQNLPDSPPSWQREDCLRFTEMATREHVPYQGSAVDKYGIQHSDLIRGVQCSECGKFGMGRKRDRWECCFCGARSMDAHKRLLREYRLLVGKEISNQQFREFSGVGTEYLARTLLSEYTRPNFGKTKNRKHIIFEDI